MKRLRKNSIMALSVVLCMFGISLLVHCQTWRVDLCVWFDFYAFYSEKLRASFFAGFLTLSGFLTSLKTFIVVNMKKEVFDTDAYRLAWEAQKKLSPEIGSRYQPLQELADCLYYAIACSVSAAVAQLTVGLIPWTYASIVCCILAVLSIIYLWQVLSIIRENLKTLFLHLDEKENR